MSLADLNTAAAANRGAVMTVLHPVDRVPLKQADGSLITMRLLGRDSDEFIAGERRARKAIREAITKRQPYSPADEDRMAVLLDERSAVGVAHFHHGAGVGDGRGVEGLREVHGSAF